MSKSAHVDDMYQPARYATFKSSMTRRGLLDGDRPTRRLIIVLAGFFALGIFFRSLRPDGSTGDALIDEQGLAQDFAAPAQSNIGKVTYLRSEDVEDVGYSRTAMLQERHNDIFGYPMHTLNEDLVDGTWNKPLWLLTVLTKELQRPKAERLEWLMWLDSDVTIMNPRLDLNLFLPPQHEYPQIKLVVCNHDKVLSDIVFFIKVDPWSVQFLTTLLAMEVYEPDTRLEKGFSSAMELWDLYRSQVMHVPQRWLSPNAGEWTGILERTPELERLRIPASFRSANTIRPGDLLVHHSTNPASRKERMGLWLRLAETQSPKWEVDATKTTLKEDIEQFWTKDAPKEKEMVDKLITYSGFPRNRLRDLRCTEQRLAVP